MMLMSGELPVLGASHSRAEGTRDLARGWNVLLFWGGPLAWMAVVDVAGQVFRLSFLLFGALLLVGTVWFGALCLVNAVRCGRTHCWVDGTLLPVLAVVGGLNLTDVVRISWGSYLVAFWVILVASIICECVVGSYPRSPGS